MKSLFRNHGLSIVLLLLFLGIWVGQTFTGLREHNNEAIEHGIPQLTLSQYLTSGHFWEATAENWESEFLQMGMFVILTVFLFQKGSPESKDPDEQAPQDMDPEKMRHRPGAPWPVRKGGWMMRLYSHSLSLAFLLLFSLSFLVHGVAGVREYNQDQLAHGESAKTVLGYIGTSRFWFESLQNWQSEFLAIL